MTEKDFDGLQATNLKKLAIFSKCAVRDIARLKLLCA